MSDAYLIEGVTVTPQGGGWYLLSHPQLAEPEKVQGKEVADARAAELAQSLSQDDSSSMAPQGDLPPVPPAADPDAPTVADVIGGKDDEIAQLKAQLAAQTSRADAAEGQVSDLQAQIETKTVVTDGGELPPVSAIPAGVPRAYSSVLDDTAKNELKKLGVETTEIILEENETIPPTGLFLGHNGRGYVIVPGEPVTVPNFLLGVLDDAVMAAPVVDTKTQKVLGYRSRSRYPYRKLS